MNLSETLAILVIFATAVGAALERTPDGLRLSATRAKTVMRQIRDQIKGAYSEAMARSHRERLAQWAAVGVLGDRAVDISVRTWGEAPRGPRELSYWCSALDCDVNEATGWRSLSPNLERWKQWRAAGLDIECARKWFHLDDSIPAERASPWNAAGFEPAVAVTWLRKDFSVEDALKLSHDGLLTFEDATELSMVGRLAVLNIEDLPIAEWIESGFRGRIREIGEWAAHQFSAQEAKSWRAAVGTASASAVWRDLGFEPHTATDWLMQGCSAAQARRFLAAGVVSDPAFDGAVNSSSIPIADLPKWKLSHEQETYWSDEQVERICEWFGAGYTDAAEVAAWIDLKVTPRAATMWKSIASLSHEDARPWIVEGITPQTAADWSQATPLPATARRWIACGFSVRDYREWVGLLGAIEPEEAKEWRDSRFAIASARDWVASGCTPFLASSLITIGLDSAEVESWRPWLNDVARIQLWRQAGFASVEIAEPWFDHGLSPEVARAWSVLTAITPKEAAEWRACGFEPGTAEAWIAGGVSPSRAKAWFTSGIRDPLSVRYVDQLLPAGPVTQEIANTVSEVAGWLRSNTAPDTIRERILKKHPPVGGNIGLGPR